MKFKLKNSSFFSYLYVVLSKMVLFVLSVVLPFKRNRILFTSFSGRQFSDSPRTIYEEIQKTPLKDKVECVWAFKNPEKFPEVSTKVPINSLKFFVLLATSGVWVANSSIDRMTAYKPRRTTYINTWHGCPWKVIGAEEPLIDPLMKYWYKHVNFDLLTSNGIKDKRIFNSIFESTPNEAIVSEGLPRNDELLEFLKLSKVERESQKKKIKKKIGLDSDKKIILYAPTFRDTDHDNSSYLSFKIPQWQTLLSHFQVLTRSHYNVKDGMNTPESTINVSDYPNLNDLFLIADILISDYSSLIFDFSILEKPIILYMNDFDDYKAERGFFFSKNDIGLPFEESEKTLITLVMNFENYDLEKVKDFNYRFNGVEKLFNSTEIIINKIKQVVL